MANIPPSRSPRKHPRLPIPDFQALRIDTNVSSSQGTTSPTSPISPIKENITWKDTLRKSFRRGWANWPQVEGNKLGSGMKYTIKMNDHILMYTDLPTPKAKFEEAMKYMSDIQGMRTTNPKGVVTLMVESVQESMILVIFGSNLIERVGENLDETKRICESNFSRRARIAKAPYRRV